MKEDYKFKLLGIDPAVPGGDRSVSPARQEGETPTDVELFTKYFREKVGRDPDWQKAYDLSHLYAFQAGHEAVQRELSAKQAELESLKAAQGWISVKDRKPKHRQRVLAWENRFNVFTFHGEPGDDGEGRIRMGDATFISGDAEWASMSEMDRAAYGNDPEKYRHANMRWDMWHGHGLGGFHDPDVTHWMPLPTPPVEQPPTGEENE